MPAEEAEVRFERSISRLIGEGEDKPHDVLYGTKRRELEENV